ncbi:hypothetical protein HVTV-2_gp94 [Haloarcula virus HVTV-2]|uniref:Uncharacterized protein n=1 Tax=Haloarcula vallismortis tailed virus 1 TaxID=1262528 RepID=L7TJ99_9CAUD|nr:hypothetical protein HVTV1_94 [Haloarcula vallismortis tailed virus 1]AGC34463.1 hypothetical protein HVTV1_94 [Haloarcula vallismortis tailed virus 1]UBF22901.1 hypothetical protein HVTV-2_gp94 [Haloarcula virus HVTV-2]
MPTCPCCGHEIPIGQARLTDDEIRRLPMGNQHDDNLTLIQWQVVKGAAVYYEVTDWTSKIDTSLGLSENVNLMEKYGTNMDAAGGRTLKDAAAEERAKMRWSEND